MKGQRENNAQHKFETGQSSKKKKRKLKCERQVKKGNHPLFSNQLRDLGDRGQRGGGIKVRQGATTLLGAKKETMEGGEKKGREQHEIVRLRSASMGRKGGEGQRERGKTRGKNPIPIVEKFGGGWELKKTRGGRGEEKRRGPACRISLGAVVSLRRVPPSPW